MELVKPSRLRKGDTIRLVAPASSIESLDKKDVDRGIGNLEKLGFEVELSPEALTTWRGTAGPAKERACPDGRLYGPRRGWLDVRLGRLQQQRSAGVP